jgi:hypothetical protein
MSEKVLILCDVHEAKFPLQFFAFSTHIAHLRTQEKSLAPLWWGGGKGSVGEWEKAFSTEPKNFPTDIIHKHHMKAAAAAAAPAHTLAAVLTLPRSWRE